MRSARMRFATLLGLCLATVLAEQGARYLVICDDSLLEAIEPLSEWRHAAGLRTKVVPLSEAGTDSAAVRGYVIDARENWPVPPEYVLLAADPGVLPAPHYSGGHDVYYSDSYYGDTEGDHHMELAVGRFPARTVEECELMVAKTLAYEKNPELADSLWMCRLTTVIREDNDADDTIYWNDVRLAATLAAGAGFTGCDSLSRLRGNDTADVLGAVDAGTGIVLYRGQACGWWHSPFWFNPASTRNGALLPIVLSITCSTLSLDPVEVMMGKQWMRTGTAGTLAGAVAFFGNGHCDGSVARERSAITRGFFRGLFSEHRDRLGDAVLRAKDSLYRAFPEAIADYRSFGLYGDPALRIWTGTPLRADVSHPVEIPPGPQDIEVTVSHDGNPIAGALVCATMDTSVYSLGATDSLGRTLLPVSPPDTGRMRLTVTGRNIYPYDGPIAVAIQTAVHGTTRSPGLKVLARPTAFRFRTTLFCEPGIDVTIRDACGRLVRVLTCNENGETTWDGLTGHGDRARAGVYFACPGKGSRPAESMRLTRLP